MYCIVYKDKKSPEWKLFTNEIWMTRKDGEEYAKRNKFSKKAKNGKFFGMIKNIRYDN
jgi:hypothetical protein